MSSDVKDTIEVIETALAAPQGRRTGISSYPKKRVVATKVKALAAKARERLTTMAATLNQSAHEKVNASTNMQIKALADLV